MTDRMRIDKWLWHARLAKTRSLAGRLCAAGLVRLDGRVASKASTSVRIGSQVELPRGPWLLSVRILGFGDRRGPASEASRLYEEAAPPRARTVVEAWEPLLGDDEVADPALSALQAENID